MGTAQGPLHLLLLDKPSADYLINRGFHKSGTDGFALAVAFPVDDMSRQAATPAATLSALCKTVPINKLVTGRRKPSRK
jgi:hypothetical protein